ncbi:hypothetical protein [Vallitalea guaymasensis]|uniref:hypothetical protein n=1 Tax=Vallitalea guaymasensis TaxID=1185412 RepID=UPI002357A45F|nr:hypothetical protein [Vallitalea guaymasensis]
MTIVQEYRRIVERIAVQESQLTTAKIDLQKNMNIYKPTDVKAITYDQERVQTSMQQHSIFIIANNILILTNFIKELELEIKKLNEQKVELEKTINELGDIKKKVTMYMIKGYPQWKIARELHYSKRHIERICSQLKDVGEISV